MMSLQEYTPPPPPSGSGDTLQQCCGSASKKCGCGSREKSQCGCGSGYGFMPLLNYGRPSNSIRKLKRDSPARFWFRFLKYINRPMPDFQKFLKILKPEVCGHLPIPPTDRLTSWGILYHHCTVPVYKLLFIRQ
jgi:hypothetical protein